mgnify:CR=1 FL=1
MDNLFTQNYEILRYSLARSKVDASKYHGRITVNINGTIKTVRGELDEIVVIRANDKFIYLELSKLFF